MHFNRSFNINHSHQNFSVLTRGQKGLTVQNMSKNKNVLNDDLVDL